MHSVRERDVLNHFLETGKPLKIGGLTVGDAAQWYKGIMPVEIKDWHAPPRQGWLPTPEILREEIMRLQTMLGEASKATCEVAASPKINDGDYAYDNLKTAKVVVDRKRYRYINWNDTGSVQLINKIHTAPNDNCHGCSSSVSADRLGSIYITTATLSMWDKAGCNGDGPWSGWTRRARRNETWSQKMALIQAFRQNNG